MRKITTPLTKKVIQSLKVGDECELSGIIFTARDQAHKRLAEAISRRKRLPFDLKDQIIYYCGPTKAPRGKIIGSCGPTTSSRMDEFTPLLLHRGLAAMIGKGNRSKEVSQAIKRNTGVYFLTLAGCGALLSEYVISTRVVGYKELGPEAIYRLEVKNFPLIVGIDSKGKNIFNSKQ